LQKLVLVSYWCLIALKCAEISHFTILCQGVYFNKSPLNIL
jgi:hypothetical protein